MMVDGKPFDESHQYIYKNSFVNGSFIPEYLLSLYLCKVKCFIHMPISCNGTHLLHSHCFKYHQYLLLSFRMFSSFHILLDNDQNMSLDKIHHPFHECHVRENLKFNMIKVEKVKINKCC